LFVQILRLCQKAGMVGLGLVALDGTKVKPMRPSTKPCATSGCSRRRRRWRRRSRN
jgi:hypothetical protein